VKGNGLSVKKLLDEWRECHATNFYNKL